MTFCRIPALILTLFVAAILTTGCGGSSNMNEPVNGTPSLSALSADNVLVGSADLTLSLTGTGFVSGANVSFGSSTLTPTAVTPSQLSVVVPQNLLTSANIVSVTVTNPAPGGGVSNALQFTIKNTIPTVESLSVNSIIVGSPDLTVDLSGSGFVPGSMVHFGSTDLTPTAVTSTKVSVVIPELLLASTGVIPIATSNPEPGGGISNALNFTVGNPVPTLTSFVTSSTLINSTSFALEISGQGFVTGSEVHFGSDIVTPSAITPTLLTVPIPDNLLTTARMVPVTVTNPEPIGGTSNSMDFGVHNPVPEITALSVDTVEAGTQQDLTISLTGKNFVGGATVAFGAQQLSPTSTTADTIEVLIPMTSLATGVQTTITVTNPGPGGGASNARTFTVTNPVPVLTALSQADAMAGDPSFELELIGEKFVPNTTVNFGGTTLTPSSVSSNQLIVSVPESAFATGGLIQVSVANPGPGGGVSAGADFTINNPVPAITSVLPTSITNTGSDITITLSGTNFVQSSTVKIGTDELTPTQTSKTSLQVTLPSTMVAGAVAAGSIPIGVSNPTPSGGLSNTFNLIVHDKAALIWYSVADTSTLVPGNTVPFSIFGLPAINSNGLVAFSGISAPSTSETGETSSVLGVYTASSNNPAQSLKKVADTATLVPAPNTLTYGQTLAKFGGFSPNASIDQSSPVVGFAANHPPVMQVGSGKAGSAGLYGNPATSLLTGVGLITVDPYTYFQVPDLTMPAGTPFGALPVSPAVVNGTTFVFKGDYLNGTTLAMGVYFRDLQASNGASPVELIASTVSTMIPNQGVRFGYIGAPSAVGSDVVFVGYNRKDSPAAGGIYYSPLLPAPPSGDPTNLVPLVTIGSPVPGETATFNQFSDNISFDGRYVGFWGAWGTETTTRHITCPTDINPTVSAYCQTVFPDGYDAKVPVHQGIFVYDRQTQTITTIAKTANGFSDFTYWPFVGTPPEVPPTTGGGSGEVEVSLEAPAFVLTPNVVVAGSTTGGFQVAFEASTGTADGIYMASGQGLDKIVTAVDTTMPSTTLNINADPTSQIKSIYLGREGMRDNWLTIGSTMVDSATKATTSGIFSTSTSNQQ
jgi:hypothetical protein